MTRFVLLSSPLRSTLLSATLTGATLAGVTLCSVCSTAAPAMAQESEAPAPTVRDVDEIAARLDSDDADVVREAIDLLSVIDHPSVVPPITALLRSGRSDEVTDRALQALRGLAHPSSIDVLVEFTRHRRARARRLAYQGLAAIEDRR
ncbi:MAG: HEAT repeat domain-containing protein, partial [Sandaracinaceae bacterium]